MVGVSNRGGGRNEDDWEYEPDPMGRLGQGRWVRRNRRDPFGRLFADPPGPPKTGPNDEPGPLGLLAPVGPGQWNLGDDVDRVEGMLMRTGHLVPDPIVTGKRDYMARQEQAIKAFQHDHGLRQDGLINPNGPTHRTLLATLETMKDAVGDVPGSKDGAASEGRGQESRTQDEGQVAFAPALLLIPPALEGAAVVTGQILLGLGLTGLVLSLSGDTPRTEEETEDRKDDTGNPEESEAGYYTARNAALQDRALGLLIKPLVESRGDETTQKGNDIAVRSCLDVAAEEFPDLRDRIEHVKGATKDGKGEERKKERYLPNRSNPDRPHKESARSDVAFKLKWGNDYFIDLNTTDMLTDGVAPTARERRALEKISRLGSWLADHMPKLRPGMDEEEYEDRVRGRCLALFQKVREKAREEGLQDDESEAEPE